MSADFTGGLKWHDQFCYGTEIPLVGDFNGDGKDDIATFTRGTTADVYLALSNGHEFQGTGWQRQDSFCPGQQLPRIGDFDGDGRSDLASFARGTAGDVYVALGKQTPTNYAVLFSGGVDTSQNYARYYNNLKELYTTITTQCNVLPENIYVIYADGTDPAVDREDGKNSDMSFASEAHVLSATKSHLTTTLSTLASLVDGSDHFLFYSFDHGSGSLNAPKITGEEVLCGWGENIRDDELAPALRSVHAAHSTYVFARCFAGGMLDDLTGLGSQNFGCASTNHYEYSYGDNFASAFVDALQNGYRYTSAAFRYARQHDSSADQGTYPDNGGTYTVDVEHPWCTGGSFPIFLSASNATSNSIELRPAITTPLSAVQTVRQAAANPIEVAGKPVWTMAARNVAQEDRTGKRFSPLPVDKAVLQMTADDLRDRKHVDLAWVDRSSRISAAGARPREVLGVKEPGSLASGRHANDLALAVEPAWTDLERIFSMGSSTKRYG